MTATGTTATTTTATTTAAAAKTGLSSKFVAAAKAFKADILKVVAAAPTVLTKIENDAPEVTALVALAFPGASAIETASLAVADAVEAVIAKTGTATAANGLNVASDQGVIQAVEALATAVKAIKL
jgi:hypothetical protein